MTAQTQLVHIRLPGQLHAEFKAEAARSGSTMQDLITGRLADARPGVAASGLERVFDSRFDESLLDHLLDVTRRASRVCLYGITLLDFLSDEGWARPVLTAAPGDTPIRIVLQDPDSDLTALKLDLQLDEVDRTRSGKYLDLEYASQRLGSLVESDARMDARLAPVYPAVRWMLLSECTVVYEPHVLRAHRQGVPSRPDRLPVWSFVGTSAVGIRMDEHFETAWNLGRCLS